MFSPRFEAELPEDFRMIGATVRNQYTLTYRQPTPNWMALTAS